MRQLHKLLKSSKLFFTQVINYIESMLLMLRSYDEICLDDRSCVLIKRFVLKKLSSYKFNLNKLYRSIWLSFSLYDQFP